MDLMPDLRIADAVARCPIPVLATLRSTAEGGAGTTSTSLREERLWAAHEAGALLVDLEAERDIDLLRQLDPDRVVLSWHDTEGTPTDLAQRCENMLSHPARWVKVVPTARRLADAEAVLCEHDRNRGRRSGQRRLVIFAMGAVGQVTRYLAPLLGPPLGFAAWSRDAAAAPGQITIADTERAIGHLSGPPRRVFAVVGRDTSRSLSPALHGAAFRHLGLHDVMLPISVVEAKELDRLFVPRAEGLFASIGLESHGFAVTTPYKRQAALAATVASPRVRTAQAANTLVLRSHQIYADTTDADGVVGGLTAQGIDPIERVVLVQGTGGAARGAAVGLHLAGARVLLRGRSEERTRSIADSMGIEWLGPSATPPEISILVNATPLGAEDDPLPFLDTEIAGCDAIVDMVYRDQPTPLARRATASARALVDGREVLAHQGFAQFAAFTGQMPPREAMLEAVRAPAARSREDER